jgi:Zn-dependent M28 family amino/carboxypeptidase
VTLAGTDVVFVGYGVDAPERHWNDYQGVDVRGKTVLILVNDPDWQNPLGVGAFGGAAMTYYGRWTYKYEEAARHGAAAAIIVHGDAAAGYPFSVLTSSLSGTRVSLDHTNEPLLVEAWITHAGAEKLVALAGESLDQLTKAAGTPGFRGRPLGLAAKFDFKVNARAGLSNNLVGVLSGKTHPDEYVLYTAHWDHLGRCRPDDTGDDICNGAIDNASGVAGLLELARAFHRKGATGRSVIFMATTGEEYGLLGSQYYAAHPVYPLADTVADIDIDPLSYMLGATKDISLVADQTELAGIVREAAAAQGRTVTPDTLPEAGMRYRSDTLSFSRAGLPVVVLGNGIDVIGKPPGWGSRKLDDYVTHRYHQPSDAYDPQWDWSGAVQDMGLYFAIGQRLANGRDWPNWFVNDEFRMARDAVLKAACAQEADEKSARLSTASSSDSRCRSP